MPQRRPGPSGIRFGRMNRFDGDELAAVLLHGHVVGMVARMRNGRVGGLGVAGQMLRIRQELTEEDLAGADWPAIRRAVREALGIADASVILLAAARQETDLANWRGREEGRKT